MRAAAATIAIAALALGCRAPAPAPPAVATPRGSISVTAFGARGDGVTDDRAAIQAAIDEAARRGGVVYIPPGTYSVGSATGQFYGLRMPGHVTLRGAGRGATALREAPGIGVSVRLLYITGDDNLLEDLTLDGNKGRQGVNEQRHGIFAFDSHRLVVRRVTSRNFTGDGFYLYNGASESRFFDVLATGNDRNGLTFGGMVDRTQIVGSKFVGNRAQQVDSEPGGANIVSDTTITGSLLDTGGVSDQPVLTCSGSSTVNRGHGWQVGGNTINGGIFVVWADDVVIAGNTGVNPTSKASVAVSRSSSNVQIRGNRFRMTQTRVPALAAVWIQGTSGSGPSRILVVDNQFQMDYERSFGIRVQGALSVEIANNHLRGAGRSAPGFAGIQLRATVLERDFDRAVITDNTISNFGDRGIQIAGNGAARLLSVDIRRNRFEDDTPTPSMTTAISLDDGSGAARDIAVTDNELGRGMTRDVIDIPAPARGAKVFVKRSGAGAKFGAKAGAKTGVVPK